jgi:hypothetical protein
MKHPRDTPGEAPATWQQRAREDGAVENWDADVLAALTRRDGRTDADLVAYPIRLDRQVAALVDDLLAPLAASHGALAGHAVDAVDDPLADVRSANAEAALLHWLSAKRRQQAQPREGDSASLPTLAMLVQRFDDSQRHTLIDITLTLPPKLMAELDSEIANVIRDMVTADVMASDERDEWAMDAWDDLRSVVFESALRVWLELRGVGPDEPRPR